MPITEPVWVISETPARAIPKSVTRLCPRRRRSRSGASGRGGRSRCGGRSAAASSTWRITATASSRRGLVDQLLQRRPFDVLHGDVVGALEFAAVVDGDDVRVLQPAADSASRRNRSTNSRSWAKRRCRTFSAIRALQVRVFGEPDVGHPAAADPSQDPVAAVDDAALADLSHALLLSLSTHSPFRIASATSRKIGAATSLPNCGRCTRRRLRSRSSGRRRGRSR